MFIGLMGVKNDGTLVTPSGIELIKVPIRLGAKIQKIQHWIAEKTWSDECWKARAEKAESALAYANNHMKSIIQVGETRGNQRDAMIMCLAAISTAAMQDTEESCKDRITQDNPAWSPAYADMCRKVDQLIALRATIKQEADYCYGWAANAEMTGDDDRAKRHKERGDRLMASI